MHRVVAHIGDVAHHARHGQPAPGRRAAVIVAFVPVRIGHNGLPPHLIEGDLLGAMPARAGDRNRRNQAVGVSHRPLQRLHSAHRPAGYREQPRNPEPVDQHPLQPHHIADGDHREGHGMWAAGGRVDRRGPGSAATSPQHIGADDEIPICLEGLARPDHVVPPPRFAGLRANPGRMGIARESVQDQNGIGFGGVQLAVGFVRHFHRRQSGAAVQRNRIKPDSVGLNDHCGRVS